MTILKQQAAAILDRRDYYKEAEAYYEGEVPETFATAKLRRSFWTTGYSGRLNFCRPIVDAVNDRIEVAAVVGSTKAATDKLQEILEVNEFGLEAQEIHRRALEFGDCYVLVWPGDDGDVLISYNSPKNVALVYDPENPRKKLYAVKMWKSGDNQTRLNIYTATAIHKYSANTDTVTDGTQWAGIGSEENPFGEVPVFHFRTHRPYGRPEHYDAYDAQNAITKLFVTNMFTIDYQGAPQRYALANYGNEGEFTDYEEGETQRENISALKNGPGELWYLQGVSQVGEFKPADSDAFWKPIKDTVSAMASLTNTPLHYFDSRVTHYSGEGRRVAEAPLIKKIQDRSASFGATWREVFKFVLKIEGINADVQVHFKPVESIDEPTRWDITLKKINAGLSHRQALREGGYDEDRIEQILAEAKEENEAGLSYKRKPVVRTTTTNDETHAVSEE